MLTIVIPVFNERATVEAAVERVLAVDYGIDIEVVLVDDASTDGTAEVLATLAREEGGAGLPGVRVFSHEENRGKGAALRTGFAQAQGELVIVQDADMEYDPNDIPSLLGPVLDGRADVVIGSRFTGGQSHRVLYFWHYLGNKFLTLMSNAFTNLNLTDMESCYKLFRKDVLDRVTLVEDRFGFEPEVTAKVARLGVRVYESGISYAGRTYAEGKKIGFRDGVRAMWCVLKYNTWAR